MNPAVSFRKLDAQRIELLQRHLVVALHGAALDAVPGLPWNGGCYALRVTVAKELNSTGAVFFGQSRGDCLAALPDVLKEAAGIIAEEPSGPVLTLKELSAGLFAIRQFHKADFSDDATPAELPALFPCLFIPFQEPKLSPYGLLRDGRGIAIATCEQAIEHVLAWKKPWTLRSRQICGNDAGWRRLEAEDSSPFGIRKQMLLLAEATVPNSHSSPAEQVPVDF